jgi:hypothetical protein
VPKGAGFYILEIIFNQETPFANLISTSCNFLFMATLN